MPSTADISTKVAKTPVTERTGFFVTVAYMSDTDIEARETTVYLGPGQSMADLAGIVSGANLDTHTVLIAAVEPLNGLTREAADAARAHGRAATVALAEATVLAAVTLLLSNG
jgi:hypothetical protein